MNFCVNPNSDLSRWSVRELRQFYANARVTDWKSIGHTKGRMNRNAALRYEAELGRRGEGFPSDDWCDLHGKFNGSGAQ